MKKINYKLIIISLVVWALGFVLWNKWINIQKYFDFNSANKSSANNPKLKKEQASSCLKKENIEYMKDEEIKQLCGYPNLSTWIVYGERTKDYDPPELSNKEYVLPERLYKIIKVNKQLWLEILNKIANADDRDAWWRGLYQLNRLIIREILHREYGFNDETIRNKYNLRFITGYNIPDWLSYNDMFSKEQLVMSKSTCYRGRKAGCQDLTKEQLEYFTLIVKIEPKLFFDIAGYIGFDSILHWGTYRWDHEEFFLESKDMKQEYFDFLKIALKWYLYNDRDQFDTIVHVLDNHNQIDDDTLEFIKSVVLIKSKTVDQITATWRHSPNYGYVTLYPFLKKYDKKFAKKIVRNYYETYKKFQYPNDIQYKNFNEFLELIANKQ